MADSESILEVLPEGDHPVAGGRSATSFSQLLFSNDDDDVVFDMGNPFHLSSSIHEKSPKMLCFGGSYQNGSEILLLSDEAATKITSQVSGGVTCSDSSSASSGNNTNNSVNVITTISQSNRKRNGSSQELPGTPPLNQRTSKRTKPENPTSTGNAKVRREKLGDRITALQQLVSPFGKTDTASVLHEAMGYIRFLHEQVQVLCSPYLQHLPEGGENGEESIKKDLRRRGLCLVPVDCTLHVASSNGADYWSPANTGNNLPSFSPSSEH